MVQTCQRRLARGSREVSEHRPCTFRIIPVSSASCIGGKRSRCPIRREDNLRDHRQFMEAQHDREYAVKEAILSTRPSHPAVGKKFVCYNATKRPGKHPSSRQSNHTIKAVPHSSELRAICSNLSRDSRVQSCDKLKSDWESDCGDVELLQKSISRLSNNLPVSSSRHILSSAVALISPCQLHSRLIYSHLPYPESRITIPVNSTSQNAAQNTNTRHQPASFARMPLAPPLATDSPSPKTPSGAISPPPHQPASTLLLRPAQAPRPFFLRHRTFISSFRFPR
jgi:hypothetical protein